MAAWLVWWCRLAGLEVVMRPSRRSLLRGGLLAAAAPVVGRLDLPLVSRACAQEAQWRHAVSLYGDIKYPPGFKHFDYVNANAPKGGLVRLAATGTFDNFNFAVAGLKGRAARGLTFIYDTMMVEGDDEVSTAYGLLAESVRCPDDLSWAIYRLRQQARWNDGKPVTPEDVVFSLDILKKQSPMYVAYYSHVVKAEKVGERDVKFTFDAPGNRELPIIVGQLKILPKHWWEGTDSSGRKRDISATSLEPPLGSGAYRIKSFEVGRRVVYERVKDYWGRDLNVNIGRSNFDELRFEYFRDLTVAREAFKADQIDFQTENSAQAWATAYDFPAVRNKRVLLEEFRIQNMGTMEAFAFNTRRAKFQDPRVRRAFNFAFDFEEMNKQLYYGACTRIDSYFHGSELAWNAPREGEETVANVPPQGLELEILETVRSQVPPEVFTTPYTNPVNGAPDKIRANLREATRLLRGAGYSVRDGRLIDGKSGEPLTAELLMADPSHERYALFLKPSLERLGVEMTLRAVDEVQYQNRLRTWDFDLVIASWPESLSPGNEQRDAWGSQSADRVASHNYIGIKNPAVDRLIDRIIFAKTRPELMAACKALDRVLLWNHYVVPLFDYNKDRTARWDRYSHPDPMPKYMSMAAFPTIWWWDAKKAARTGSR
jgi:microcin C transport system substrate-binding protein